MTIRRIKVGGLTCVSPYRCYRNLNKATVNGFGENVHRSAWIQPRREAQGQHVENGLLHKELGETSDQKSFGTPFALIVPKRLGGE